MGEQCQSATPHAFKEAMMALILLEMKLPRVASPALYRSLQSLFPRAPGMAEEALALLRGGGSFRTEMEEATRNRNSSGQGAAAGGVRATPGIAATTASEAASAAMAAAAGGNGAAGGKGMYPLGMPMAPMAVMPGPGQRPQFPAPHMFMHGGVHSVGPVMQMGGRGAPPAASVAVMGGPQMQQYVAATAQRRTAPASAAAAAQAPMGYAPTSHSQ